MRPERVCVPTRPERMLGSRRPRVTLTSRGRAEAQTANGYVRHKLSFGRVGLRGKLGSTMCFRLAFSPVLCAADLHLLVSTRLDIMCCEYRDCMFCSEWLKDAMFNSLVANDRTESFSDWCLKDRKAETESALSRLGHSQCS